MTLGGLSCPKPHWMTCYSTLKLHVQVCKQVLYEPYSHRVAERCQRRSCACAESDGGPGDEAAVACDRHRHCGLRSRIPQMSLLHACTSGKCFLYGRRIADFSCPTHIPATKTKRPHYFDIMTSTQQDCLLREPGVHCSGMSKAALPVLSYPTPYAPVLPFQFSCVQI